MARIVKTIQCEGYSTFNIGGLIEKHLDFIKENNINDASLSICNHHAHGRFKIPDAMGFSTPLATIGKGGFINFNHDKNLPANDLLDKYNKWSSVYRGIPIKKDCVINYTSDKKDCSICTETYVLGESITELYCGHWFHTKCINTWKLQHGPQDKMELFIKLAVMEESIPYNCPLCKHPQ